MYKCDKRRTLQMASALDDSDRMYFYEWDSRLRDFPEDALSNLAELLMTDLSGRNYRALGGRLGYGVARLDCIGCGSFPALALLKDWGYKEGSTLRCLRVALQEIGRIDIVDQLNVLRKREIMLMGVIYSTNRSERNEVKEIVCGRRQLWEGMMQPLKRFLSILFEESQPTDYTYFQLQSPQTPERSWLNESIQYQGKQIDIIQLNQNNRNRPQYQRLNECCEIDSRNKAIIRLLHKNTNSLCGIERVRLPIQEETGPNETKQKHVLHDRNCLRPHSNDHLRCPTGSTEQYGNRMSLPSQPAIPRDDLKLRPNPAIPSGDNFRRHTADADQLASSLDKRKPDTDEISLRSDCGGSPRTTMRSYSEPSPARFYTSNSQLRNLLACYPELEQLPAFHANLESRNCEIQRVFQPYLLKDGWYILHASFSSNNLIRFIISVTFKGSILSFIINETRRSSSSPSSGCLRSSPASSEYFLFLHQVFPSIRSLVEYYSSHPLELREGAHSAAGPLLQTYIPSDLEYRNKF